RPFCVTLPATNIDNFSAVLVGEAAPEGLDMVTWFEFGPNTNYSSRTPPQPVGSANALVIVTQAVVNLTAGTDYFFRCVASNATGLIFSPPQQFRTAGPNAVTLPPNAAIGTNMILNAAINANGLFTRYW